jgi:hypothetical protein
MWYVWGKGDVHIGFRWGNVREGDPLGIPRRRGKDNIKRGFQ